MKLLRHGKTKDVYSNDKGNIVLKFKDTVTGHASSGESDPGGNDVVGEKAGVGGAALSMTVYFFEALKKLKIPSHYVSADLSQNLLEVKPANIFGKGLEFVVRYSASGSFVRRFGDFVAEGQKLNRVYEVTLKDDARNDPVVSTQILTELNIATKKQLEEAELLAKKVCDFVRDDLTKKGLELVDIKVEIAPDASGKVMLIDEISGGNMRVNKDGKQLDYITLSSYYQ